MDKDIVMEATKQKGHALRLAYEFLKVGIEKNMKAIEEDDYPFK